MQERSWHIKDMVIPDVSVKFLDLCLTSGEDGIFDFTTHRKSKMLEFRADITLKEMISKKLKEKELAVPLALRKRKLYEKAINEAKVALIRYDFDKIFSAGVVPIIMRKHMYSQQCRVG